MILITSKNSEISVMLEYREMVMEEAERILEIDATNYIKNVWRFDEITVKNL